MCMCENAAYSHGIPSRVKSIGLEVLKNGLTVAVGVFYSISRKFAPH